MKLHQLSLFLENQPGNLLKACQVLADAGINVEIMTLADTEEFGILRLIVRDWKKAKQVFETNNFPIQVTEVIAVQMPNHPGGLASLLKCVAKTDMNIEYMYGFDSFLPNCAIIVLRFDTPDEAMKLLKENGITVLGENDIFKQ